MAHYQAIRQKYSLRVEHFARYANVPQKASPNHRENTNINLRAVSFLYHNSRDNNILALRPTLLFRNTSSPRLSHFCLGSCLTVN